MRIKGIKFFKYFVIQKMKYSEICMRRYNSIEISIIYHLTVSNISFSCIGSVSLNNNAL